MRFTLSTWENHGPWHRNHWKWINSLGAGSLTLGLPDTKNMWLSFCTWHIFNFLRHLYMIYSWESEIDTPFKHETNNMFQCTLVKLTVRTWKWMLGIRSFPFGLRPIFRGKLLVYLSVASSSHLGTDEAYCHFTSLGRGSKGAWDLLNGQCFLQNQVGLVRCEPV